METADIIGLYVLQCKYKLLKVFLKGNVQILPFFFNGILQIVFFFYNVLEMKVFFFLVKMYSSDTGCCFMALYCMLP